MSEPGHISPETKAAAVASLARLHSEDRCTSDEDAHRVWLEQDPKHQRAFEAATQVWEDLGQAGAGFAAPRPVLLTRRRALLAGVSTVAAAGVYFAMQPVAYAEVYETGVGEIKQIVLKDGTRVLLDTDSRIQTAYDDRIRSVDLERGRCNLDVLANDSRPFVVNAATERITADRATVDVRRDGDQVDVILLRGSASVSNQAGTGRTLNPGERFVDTNGNVRVDRPDLTSLLAWQIGQVVFDNVPIADAIRELNRYSAVKLAVDDPTVATLRINGVFHVGDNAAFARSIARLLPLVVRFEPDRVWLLPDPSRSRQGP